MTVYESKFSIAVLIELAINAAEDVTDALSLGVPGCDQVVRTRRTQHQRIGALLMRLARLKETYYTNAHLFDPLINCLTEWNVRLSPSDAMSLWRQFTVALDRLERLANRAEPTVEESETQTECFILAQIQASGRLQLSASTQFRIELHGLPSLGPETDFVQAVTAMCARYRAASRRYLPPVDRLALLRAYHLVEMGVIPAPRIEPLRTDQLRRFPTYLALADPGHDHLQTTVWDNKLLHGLVVHAETIDRAGITDRRQVEAYRIPSIRDVARIRVHVGEATPCSVYVGRPVFEGWRQDADRQDAQQSLFDQSLLKAAHTVAAACTGFFALGVAECKIGLDGLSAQQAIDTMQAIVGNVIRDRFRQRLSAAFNINTPIKDDRDKNRAPQVSQRLDVARLGIELAVAGGFDKVTWDGAIDGPSQPLLEQITACDLFELVHIAHQRGLETYVSAGMNESHMLTATQVGVGGVGMGILMHAKANNGAITHILPERVLTVLQVRDAAHQQTPGKAASTLAKLDWLFALGPLPERVESLRQRLYSALIEYHRDSSPESRLLNEDKLRQRLVEAEESLKSVVSSVEPATRGPETPTSSTDPVFEVAKGRLRLAEAGHPGSLSNEEAKELGFLITAEDAEAVRAFLGAD